MFKVILTVLLLLGVTCSEEGTATKFLGNGKPDQVVPYYVQIIDKTIDDNYCAGVIIAKNWILTVAHCLVDKDKHALKVISGAKQTKPNGQSYEIEDFIIHESFNNNTFENDIGLIKLLDTFKLNDEQTTVKIRSKPLEDYESVKIFGMSAFVPHRQRSKVPCSSKVPIVDRKTCQQKYFFDIRDVKVTEDMICAGSSDGDTCDSDSGSPAVDSKGQLVGLMSWGKPTSGIRVFTNMMNYREWVEKVMVSQYVDGLLRVILVRTR